MHHSETTGGLAGTVGHGPRLGCASPLNGQGVAPFGGNRRPCRNRGTRAAPGLCQPAQRTWCCTIRRQQAALLKQPEAAETGRASLKASR
ncbi:MAG: hypothetical protein LBD24_00715 [Spirochaetaceae bacterium]|nr:hypothetical protein [Spirochaetaceae bacterium]